MYALNKLSAWLRITVYMQSTIGVIDKNLHVSWVVLKTVYDLYSITEQSLRHLHYLSITG